MKSSKRPKILVIVLTMIIHVVSVAIIPASAHPQKLSVIYDECVPAPNEEGMDERWYVLSKNNSMRHISHDVTTIKYYFSEHSENSTTDTWASLIQAASSGLSYEEADDIADMMKIAYANSIEQWNNVYFYSYDLSGKITKNKLINVVEVLDSDK